MAKRELPSRGDLPSNSYSARESLEKLPEKKSYETVPHVRVRKQNLVRRLGRALIEDNIEVAREKALDDIVVPGIKSLIFDGLVAMLNVVLFGDRGYSYRGTYSQRKDRTSYRDYYDKRESNRRDRQAVSSTSLYPDDIVVATREKAEEALSDLDDIIYERGRASLAEFYDLLEVTANWTDNRYGWTDISNASIRPVRDGFMIMMPKARLLND